MLPTDDKLRKALPILTFLTEYFPDVIVELTKLCVQGNIQHNPELAPTDIKWAREKSADQMNTAFRHMFDRARGLHFDSDGVRHIIKSVWRNMAQAQLDIEAYADELNVKEAVIDTYRPIYGENTDPVQGGQTWDCYPADWPTYRPVDADLVGKLTEPERGAGLMPDHSPKPLRLCLHGLTVCKVCKFP
jgi:hypothetical protein